jgi:hypothetical protein
VPASKFNNPNVKSTAAAEAPSASSKTVAFELLTRELGRTSAYFKRPDALEAYARADESGLGVFPPDAAVLCESRAEIELVLRWRPSTASRCTPRGRARA